MPVPPEGKKTVSLNAVSAEPNKTVGKSPAKFVQKPMHNDLKVALAAIEKGIGKRTMFAPRKQEEGIPTGSEVLDYILGPASSKLKGWPRGRISEVHGWEGTGKTTLLTHSCIEAQKIGLIPAYIDFEHAFNEEYAKAQGLDPSPERFIFLQPSCIEDADFAIMELLQTKQVDLICIDSVPAMTPRSVIQDKDKQRDGMKGRAQGKKSSLLSEFLDKWAKLLSMSSTALVASNQMRAKIGDPNPEQAAGGNALKFYASTRVNVSKISTESEFKKNALTWEEEDVDTAIVIRAQTVKNKVAAPFRTVTYKIVLGKGIDNVWSLIDIGKKRGIIEHTGGGWFEYRSPNEKLQFKVRGDAELTEKFKEQVYIDDLRKNINFDNPLPPPLVKKKSEESGD